MEEVLFSREDAVLKVELNRPERLNALTPTMLEAIGRELFNASRDDSVRAVLITGRGRAFCSGADLSGAGGRDDAATPVGMRFSVQLYASMIRSIVELEKPVIAAVNGDAAGAGCNLALACDIIVASQEARFMEIFVRRGLVVDAGGTFFLPRIVGLTRAKEIMFTGRPVGAEEALELGMVTEVVNPGDVMEKAMEWAKRLASGPTRSLGMIKRLINSSFENDLITVLELEASYQGIAVSTADVAEGVTAFLQKREPRFLGR
ncbi:MAG: enoyl-CoA hydratase-related protein [Candidatus Geothermincolales bacterium]